MDENWSARDCILNKEGRPPKAAVPALHLLYVQEMYPTVCVARMQSLGEI
jgi:hypothetical protein